MSDGIWSDYPIEVVWEGGMRYRGGRPGGPTHLVDGERQAAPGPVEGVLVSLASCSAIDVVEVLNKRRTPPTSLSVRVDFSRAAEPPRRLLAVRLKYRVATASDRTHVERAVELSFDRYCSVASSLAPDLQVAWELDVTPAEAGATA